MDAFTDVAERSQYSKGAQEDIRELQTALELEKLKNAELSDQLGTQVSVTKQVVTDWKLKLDTSNKIITEQAREKDRQLSEISSDLLYFEGCLVRNRDAAHSALQKKEKRIKELGRKVQRQRKQIDALNYANERLLNSLHGCRENSESNEKRDSVSGYDSDETLCDSEQFSETEDVQYNGINQSKVNGYVIGGDRNPEIVENTAAWEESAHHHLTNGIGYYNLEESEQTSKRVDGAASPRQGNQTNNHNTNNHGTYRPVRRRKFSDVTDHYRRASAGSGLTSNGMSSSSSSNGSPKIRDLRVRFRPDVNRIQEEPDEGCVHDLIKSGERLRKYSLPAYRLPILQDDDEDEQFI